MQFRNSTIAKLNFAENVINSKAGLRKHHNYFHVCNRLSIFNRICIKSPRNPTDQDHTCSIFMLQVSFKKIDEMTSERASIPPSSRRVSVKASISVMISKWKYSFLTFPENNNFILRLDLLFDTYDFGIWPMECCKETNQEQQGHGELQKLIHDQDLQGFSTFNKILLLEKPKDFSCKV